MGVPLKIRGAISAIGELNYAAIETVSKIICWFENLNYSAWLTK